LGSTGVGFGGGGGRFELVLPLPVDGANSAIEGSLRVALDLIWSRPISGRAPICALVEVAGMPLTAVSNRRQVR
jgi:hypothetical protein